MDLDTLKNLVLSDFAHLLKIHVKQTISISKKTEKGIEEVGQKDLYLIEIDNLDENYKHAAVAIEILGPEYRHLPQAISDFLNKNLEAVRIMSKEHYSDPDREISDNRRLTFTGMVYVYANEAQDNPETITQHFRNSRMTLFIRDGEYRERLKERANPDVFICHDSRDKESFVKPLYEELSKQPLNVWYDEYSLEPGDSLTDSIESGIRKCRVCTLVVSKNLLSNQGWARSELQAIQTRQIFTKEKMIIPIWLDVVAEDVAAVSYWLLDKVAMRSSEGLTSIARKIGRIAKRKKGKEKP